MILPRKCKKPKKNYLETSNIYLKKWWYSQPSFHTHLLIRKYYAFYRRQGNENVRIDKIMLFKQETIRKILDIRENVFLTPEEIAANLLTVD